MRLRNSNLTLNITMYASFKNFHQKTRTLAYKSFVEKTKLKLQRPAALKLIQHCCAITRTTNVY